MRFYRGGLGYPRCDVAAPHQVISRFLEGDVQGSINSAEIYLQELDLVESGQSEFWSGTGNSCTVEISKTGVAIECIWDESLPISRISLGEFREILSSWRSLISSDK